MILKPIQKQAYKKYKNFNLAFLNENKFQKPTYIQDNSQDSPDQYTTKEEE